MELVYRSGKTKLIGKLADTISKQGGEIKGIMLRFMHKVEWAPKQVSDFEFTDKMHERKAKFLKSIDDLVTSPGASRTLEELLEAITLKSLGQFAKPILILDAKRFYGSLKEMLKKCVSEHFTPPKHLDRWIFIDKPGELIPAIKKAKTWDDEAIKIALNK